MQNNIVLMSIDKNELSSIVSDAIKTQLANKREKDLMNFQETCEFLGIHPSTLNRWKSRNKIPFKKLGRRIFFNRQDVIKALKDSNYSKMKEFTNG
ncbi:MAG: helix-turn-helix domain-containing protein [Melioribacteraceae bacterium]|nr:helix-turn-helix domain-containing protein [Melioribacteraceae bacterium]